KCVVIACGDVIFLKKITMPSPPPSGAPLPKGEASGVCVIELQTTIYLSNQVDWFGFFHK
ncbi:MAG: hypothetical protein IJ351_02675, partial [Oscillospiraceae bacterium]|nr:hypothetical protein [Oscillospiraceae bacterium]